MDFPADLRYTKEHEWIKLSGDTAIVGITEFAQEELGEIVFVDLPEIGKSVSPGTSFCVVESTKAASDVYAPISGKVVAVNESLSKNPALINTASYTDGWIAKLEGVNQSEIAGLLSVEDYRKLLGR